jgi:hypothetical protein
MSSNPRPMAESHSWLQPGVSKWDQPEPRRVTIANGKAEGNAAWDGVVAELLRVVAERDRLLTLMAGTLKAFAVLGLGPGASGEEFTAAVTACAADRDRLRSLAGQQYAELNRLETYNTAGGNALKRCPSCDAIHDGRRQLHTDMCELNYLLHDPDGLKAFAETTERQCRERESAYSDSLLGLLQSIAERLSVLPHDSCGELAIIQQQVDDALRAAGLLIRSGELK